MVPAKPLRVHRHDAKFAKSGEEWTNRGLRRRMILTASILGLLLGELGTLAVQFFQLAREGLQLHLHRRISQWMIEDFRLPL